MTVAVTLGLIAVIFCTLTRRAFAQAQSPAHTPAQAQTQMPSPDVDASLDRIRRALARSDQENEPVFVLDPMTPTFRTEVEGHPLDLENYWRPDNDVWSYARPWTPSRVHYDFLRMSIPDAYLGTHRYANPVFPLTSGESAVIVAAMKPLVSKLKKARAKEQQNAIRAQIQSELRAIEEANRDATRTPF